MANNRVSILAEHAEMSHEIDLEKARTDLERCRSEGAGDDEALAKAEERLGRGPGPGRGAQGLTLRVPIPLRVRRK